MKINKQLTLSQVLGAVAKHKVKSMFTFLLVTSLVVLLFLSWPRYYGSEGRIFVRVSNPSTLSDVGIADSDGSVTHTRSVEQLIKSRGVMESVVDEIGAEPILANSFFQWLKPKFNFFGTKWNQDSDGFTANEYRNLINREQAASKLENQLSVTLTENSNVISVYCLAPSSQLAQKVVDIAMKKTQEKHREINRSAGVQQKLAEELRQDEAALSAAEKRLSDFHIQNEILSVDREEARLASTIQLLEREVVSAQAELDQATERQRSLRNDAESNEETSTELKLEIVKATASMNASRARLDSLKKQQEQSQLKLRELNDKRRVASSFQRKLADAQHAVEITTARINEAKSISSTQIKDVVIAQPANFLVKHVSPRGSIVLPSGLVLAGMVATATALYFERDLLSGSLRDEEVEQILEIPVLVSLPRVASQKNMVG